MKKKVALLLLVVLSMLVLAGCACEHEWVDANCTAPKTCSLCEETEGAPLGHSWLAATCAAPKTCETCGETTGDALPHTFDDATCTAPKTCSVCQATEGEALGHTWTDATYDAPMTCEVCQATEGGVLVRADLGKTVDQLVQEIDEQLQLIGGKLEFYGSDSEGWPIYDVVDAASGTYADVYISIEPAADGTQAYSMFVCTESVSNEDATSLLGSVGAVALLTIDENFDVNLFAEALTSPIVEDDAVYYYMENQGLVVDMQFREEYVIFWIYPVV